MALRLFQQSYSAVRMTVQIHVHDRTSKSKPVLSHVPSSFKLFRCSTRILLKVIANLCSVALASETGLASC